MNSTKMNVILAVVLGVLLISSPPTIMADEKAELQVIQGNGAFTNRLYQVLSKNEGNVFFSPISAHSCLAMAYQGAKGETAQAFSSTLGVPDAALTATGYSEVMNRLNNVPNVTLLMANKIFLMQGHTLLEDFNGAVTKQFRSEVQLLDFGKNDVAAQTINAWVEQKTKDKIKDLIQKDDLNALTRLVLVNAIYFKGNWASKFNKNNTKTEPFYLNDVDKVDVQMMHQKRKFQYKYDEKVLDAQVLELPYENRDLSMIIILPNKRNGIKELEQKLADIDLTNITQGMYETEVNVSLPRFKIEQTIDLQDALTELGLGVIFDQDKANFRGMIDLNPNENLYVSKVVQKAFIEVNEEGAEAAAATGSVIHMLKRRMPIPVEFEANHPFIYALLDAAKSGNPLFYGRLLKVLPQ